LPNFCHYLLNIFFKGTKLKINLKSYKKTGYIIASIFGILLVLYIIFRSSRVQTYLTGKIIDYFSEQYDIDVEVRGIDISLFNKIILEDVLLKDLTGDSLVYLGELQTGIKKVQVSKKTLLFSDIKIKHLFFNYISDSTSSNLDFLADVFSSDDSTKTPKSKSPWDIRCNRFELMNSKANIVKNPYEKNLPGSVNYDNMRVSNINIILENLRIRDSIIFQIKDLTFNEQSGFIVKHLSADAMIKDQSVNLDHLKIYTPFSELYAKYFNLIYESGQSFKEFIDEVEFQASFILPSRLNLKDLGKFAPELSYDKDVRLVGLFDGPVSNMRISKLNLFYGKQTNIRGNLEFKGLPEIDSTDMLLNVKSVRTTKNDIDDFFQQKTSRKNEATLPDFLDNLGIITFKGIFSGALKDFIIRGSLNTSLGNLSTFFVKVFPDNKTSNQIFRGSLDMNRFHAGKLIKNKDLGRVSFRTKFRGEQPFNLRNISTTFDGLVTQLEYKAYNYQDIYLEGAFSKQSLNVFLDINDQNIQMNVGGEANFEKQYPHFAFDASLTHANLYSLGLDTLDKNAGLEFDMHIDLSGEVPDNFTGKVELYNSAYTNSRGELPLESFRLSVDTTGYNRNLTIFSDYCDVNMSGDYAISNLPLCFQHILSHYLPALFPAITSDEGIKDEICEFNFDVRFKDMKKISAILFPGHWISNDAELRGIVNAQNNEAEIYLDADSSMISGTPIEKLSVYAASIEDKFNLDITSEKLSISESARLSNFRLSNIIRNDSIFSKIIWEDDQNISKYLGEIPLLTKLKSRGINKKPRVEIEFLPTNIIINKEKWNLRNSVIYIDSTYLFFDRFTFENDKQMIKIDGALSEYKEDTLSVTLREFNLASLNQVAQDAGFTINGLLNGSVELSNLYDTPVISSNSQISDLYLNNHNLGYLNLYFDWDKIREKINIQTYIYRGRTNTFELYGSYSPATDSVDMNVKLDKFFLNTLSNFIEENISDINGIVSTDQIQIGGTLSEPEVNGKLKIQKGSLIVDYLQTQYTFTDSFEIRPNKIVFDNFKINDYRNDSAFITGEIRHNKFSDFYFDLNLEADNFQFLNTKEYDNELFYGDAFATGIISVSGPADDIIISANAVAEKNTGIYIPLYSSEEVSETDFITFVNSDSVMQTSENGGNDIYAVDMSGFILDFNLEATPDAEIQLILDETVGDIIKARGSGNIAMEIDTKGDFTMKGEYTIEEGEYLFTLQNVINKKFYIRENSKIIWSGDPYNANIDLSAIYRLKNVPMYDLTLDDDLRNSKFKVVNCIINMTGNLLTPDIDFAIETPEYKDPARNPLNNLNEDEINKQFLSLLIIKRFQPQAGFEPVTENVTVEKDLSQSVSEVLTNQLGRWLSQISDDFDVGLKYKTANDTLRRAEIEVALSTQLLNDRVAINSNVNMGGDEELDEEKFLGEFDIEYKITESGKLRVKYYTKQEQNLMYDTYYKQGIGIFYKKDFDSLKDLFMKKENKKTQGLPDTTDLR
jgi:hypothetical protein